METVIIDAGPLVAYLKRDEQYHAWVSQIFRRLLSPLRTCDAALSEAFFLLQKNRNARENLLELLERGIVAPDFNLPGELPAVSHFHLYRKHRRQAIPLIMPD